MGRQGDQMNREWVITEGRSDDCAHRLYQGDKYGCDHPALHKQCENECTEDACPIKPNTKIQDALDLIYMYGGTDGDFHQKWLVDQVLRVLTGEDYDVWVKDYEEGGEYEWEEGIPI